MKLILSGAHCTLTTHQRRIPQLASCLTLKTRSVVGWIATIVSTLMAAFWAFWGSIETFHEGWYYHSFWKNIGLAFAQYLSPMMLFILLGVAALRWPRLGGFCCALLGIIVPAFYVRTPAALEAISAPMVVLGILYWFGRPRPVQWAYLSVVMVPLIVALTFGIGPALRVRGRIDDGIHDARIVEGNGVSLLWAPRGPGWPDDMRGWTWGEADSICSYLSESGTTLAATPQNIWRLPTIDEAVRSFTRHGHNAGGIWDSTSSRATYSVEPDKESPLWDAYSPVISWWTANSIDDLSAYKVVYNGQVYPSRKRTRLIYLGFRAVRDRAASVY
ncbi:MAG TPA: DUF1566 domain-containing protein [Bacteroidota bacterium]|nr:DUF1566 domain-containing protein [Bacteroidota bacterium]